MEVFNGISDLVLFITSLYVFFRYINPLNFSSTVLWESFILSVAVASFFGALSFFGLEKAEPISVFFQKLATINGAIGLVGGSLALVTGSDLSRWGAYSFIIAGFLFFTLYEVFGVRLIYFWIPVIAIGIVFFLALFALVKGEIRIGLWLLIGLTFFALGSFRKQIFGESDFSVSLYHFLMAAGVLSIGMANSKVKLVKKN